MPLPQTGAAATRRTVERAESAEEAKYSALRALVSLEDEEAMPGTSDTAEENATIVELCPPPVPPVSPFVPPLSPPFVPPVAPPSVPASSPPPREEDNRDKNDVKLLCDEARET